MRNVLTVFIASPSDLAPERQRAFDLVAELNDVLRSTDWAIELLGWEDTLPGYGRPQALINRDVERCDLFIGAVWGKWGTPPSQDSLFASGFEEEYSIAVKRRERASSPEIWMFFKKVDIAQVADPGPQLQRVITFRESLVASKTVLFKEFESVDAWEKMLRRYLLAYVDIGLPPQPYAEKASQDRFFGDLLEAVQALSVVQRASIGTPPPNGGAGQFVVEGRETVAETSPALTIHHVDPGYFATAGIPIKSGRAIGPDDRASTPPVAVIDEDAARRFWPGQDAIGRRFRYSPYVPWITVVGVAGGVKTQSFTSPRGSIQIYLPHAQEESAPFRTLLLRSAGEPAAALKAVTAVVRQLDPRVSIRRAGIVAGLYDETVKTPQFLASVMSLFALVGLVTAAVGLHGVLSYAVAQRTKEIGVRIALGANSSDVRRMVVLDALRPVVLGMGAGTVGAVWLTRLISSQLYGVSANDPLTYSVVILILLLVAVLASTHPARRATRIDPIAALRTE